MCSSEVSVVPDCEGYRLPTEAEWEYATRAGTQTTYSFGDDPSALQGFAWYRHNAMGGPHAVGSRRPNPWGLFDVHGNLWEWVFDGHYMYPAMPPPAAVVDPVGPSHELRTLRGGSVEDAAAANSSAMRLWWSAETPFSNAGIRLVRSLP